ncbi:hypothetical protein ACFQ6N_38960 [Kitasatospora sp. NPDC056446]|uniref:hypothetical protein n=1 Tax=Kitasatospora sp. NPDC056446 TaxID=3345819 RepID=UPI0036B9B3BD
MSSNVFRSGIGWLHLDRGPDGLSVWSVAEAPRSALYEAAVEVNILLEGSDDIDRADLTLVGEVMGRIDHYLETGLRFVGEAVEADPAFFGLTEPEAESYRGLPATDVPLDSPQLNFYADEWHLRFAEGRLPICDPYGLAVVFHGQRPLRIDDLSDATDVDVDVDVSVDVDGSGIAGGADGSGRQGP